MGQHLKSRCTQMALARQKKTAHSRLDTPGADSRPRFIWLPVMSRQHYVSTSRRGNVAMDPKDENS